MPKRDTIANHSALIAKWYARLREQNSYQRAKGVVGHRLLIALTGPHFDKPEYKDAVAAGLGKVFAPLELKALATFIKLNQKSRSRIFPIMEMVCRSQDVRTLPDADAQLLKDEFETGEKNEYRKLASDT